MRDKQQILAEFENLLVATVNSARVEAWRDACSAVSDAINVGSMAPARPTRTDLETASAAVMRARQAVTEVSRRGPTPIQQEGLGENEAS